MFFEDFFGMDPSPSSYSSLSPRMDPQFPAQCYSDYSPYYGYASPVSSRRPRQVGYYPFQSPVQTETQFRRKTPMDSCAAFAQRPVMRDNQTVTEHDSAPGCSGCSECDYKNPSRRSTVRPGFNNVRAKNGYHQNEEDTESSSEEEEKRRYSPPLSHRQIPKKSKSVMQGRNSAGNKRRSVCDITPTPIQKLDRSSIANEEKIPTPFAVSKNINGDQPINVKKSAEAEDIERSPAEVTMEHIVPVQNVQNVKTSTEILNDIQGETEALDARIEAYTGSTKDREYIIIDELITKVLLRLDAVESGGDVNIRNARRSLVKHVQTLLERLEQKIGIVKMAEVQQEGASCGVDSSTELQDTPMIDEANEQEPKEKLTSDEVLDSNMEASNVAMAESGDS